MKSIIWLVAICSISGAAFGVDVLLISLPKGKAELKVPLSAVRALELTVFPDPDPSKPQGVHCVLSAPAAQSLLKDIGFQDFFRTDAVAASMLTGELTLTVGKDLTHSETYKFSIQNQRLLQNDTAYYRLKKELSFKSCPAR
jgi:hypothetical protein